MDSCPDLAWLQSTFAGCNQLLTASSRRDYTATRLAGCFGPDMAEYTMLHVLRLERGYDELRANQARGEWADVRSSSAGDYRRLPSLTLGVLGLGDIGSTIARAASAGFGMQIVGCRRDKTPRASDGDVARVFGLDELPAFLASADYIVSVLPSAPDTRGLLDGDALAACAGRSPALINVGRGDLSPRRRSSPRSTPAGSATTSATCSRQSRRRGVAALEPPKGPSAAQQRGDEGGGRRRRLHEEPRALGSGAAAVENQFRWDEGY